MIPSIDKDLEFLEQIVKQHNKPSKTSSGIYLPITSLMLIMCLLMLAITLTMASEIHDLNNKIDSIENLRVEAGLHQCKPGENANTADIAGRKMTPGKTSMTLC